MQPQGKRMKEDKSQKKGLTPRRVFMQAGVFILVWVVGYGLTRVIAQAMQNRGGPGEELTEQVDMFTPDPAP
ncbi:MAG: hypothetical protein FWD16_02950, partial [Clostridia bacterium]|nr:hypothetical protein [Clostridia bacterium]